MNLSKKLFKVILDMLMLVFIVIEMSIHTVGPKAHMLLGLILFILFIIHNIVEYKWYISIVKSHMTPIKFVTVLINIALLLNMIILMISAAFLPYYMNKIVPYSIIYTAKGIHTMAGNWLFIIISIHLSIHPATAVSKVEKTEDNHPKNSRQYIGDFIKYALLILLSIYGIKAFIDRDVALKMVGMYSMNQWKMERSIFKPILDYSCIMIMISYISYLILKLIKKGDGQK